MRIESLNPSWEWTSSRGKVSMDTLMLSQAAQRYVVVLENGLGYGGVCDWRLAR